MLPEGGKQSLSRIGQPFHIPGAQYMISPAKTQETGGKA